MDLRLTESQALVRKSAHDFATRVLAPIAAELDATERFPREILRALANLGLNTINVAPELGGTGAGPVAFALAIEELAQACASTAVMSSVTNMVAETIARFGTHAQTRRHCPRLAAGEYVVGSFALSEPDVGSDAGAIRTTARRDGQAWVIDGAKQWITGGGHAGIFLVWARTAPPSTGAKGISCFLVEAGTPGLRAGAAEAKLGIRASNTVPLELEACRVPADALLGRENGGFHVAMAALDGGRIGISAQAVGIARAALAASVSFARARDAFDVPIANHQVARFELADMQMQIDAAHLLTMRAAWLKEQNRPFTREAAMAKVVASETAVRVCNDAVRMHGGSGYLRDLPVERHLRDARVTTIYEGTSEIQRLVIARSLLG